MKILFVQTVHGVRPSDRTSDAVRETVPFEAPDDSDLRFIEWVEEKDGKPAMCIATWVMPETVRGKTKEMIRAEREAKYGTRN